MGETVRPWGTAPGGPGSEVLESMDWANDREPDPPEMMPEPAHTKERRNEMCNPEDDEDEYANSMLWPAEGLREPAQPDQQIPQSKEAVVTLSFVETGTSRQMKPYADLTVNDNTTGERFRVRTVKLYEEMRDLKPGAVMRIKWFENGPFRNLVSGTVLSSAPKPASAPVKEVTQAVYISTKEPKDALDVLMTEWFNRARFLWMNADGTTMDVKEMTRKQLQDAIAECERLCKENKQ